MLRYLNMDFFVRTWILPPHKELCTKRCMQSEKSRWDRIVIFRIISFPVIWMSLNLKISVLVVSNFFPNSSTGSCNWISCNGYWVYCDTVPILKKVARYGSGIGTVLFGHDCSVVVFRATFFFAIPKKFCSALLNDIWYRYLLLFTQQQGWIKKG